MVQELKLQWRGKKAFQLQEALDRDNTVTEFIKETGNCAISMLSENSSMQMGSRGEALKSVTNQHTSKGDLRVKVCTLQNSHICFASNPASVSAAAAAAAACHSKPDQVRIKSGWVICGKTSGGSAEIRIGQGEGGAGENLSSQCPPQEYLQSKVK